MSLAVLPADHHLRKLEQALAQGAPVNAAAQPLGLMIAVSGAQATIRFSQDVSGDDSKDFSVGTYLGIRTASSLVIGALCDIVFEAGTQQTTGRMDMLGEIVADASGTERFQRGVSHYPKVGSHVFVIGERELRLIFDVAGPSTISIGHLQQDRSIGAY